MKIVVVGLGYVGLPNAVCLLSTFKSLAFMEGLVSDEVSEEKFKTWLELGSIEIK